MTSQPTTDAERISRRYPASRTPGWTWIVLATALAAVGGTWLIWSALHGANPAISAKIVSFTVTSDQTVNVRITTQRPDPAQAAVCTLTAQAVTYDTVGQHILELQPGETELEHHDLTIRTFKRPTSVKIDGCVPR